MKDFCEKIWKTPQVEVPKPSLNPKQRVRSWANLLSLNKPQLNSNGFDEEDGGDSKTSEDENSKQKTTPH